MNFRFLKIDIVKLLKDNWILLLSFIIITIIRSYGMFIYPYYENDEGVYISQAWALLEKGELSHYTYWYDHAPGGWFSIGLLVKLMGGYFAYGLNSIDAGRVAMLIMNLFSCFFIYKIIYNLTEKKWLGIIGMLFFTLSPLVVYHQRRLLLDNIMVFWLLFSLSIVTIKKIKMSDVMLSGILLSFSFLSKESAIFLVPPIIFYLYNKLIKDQKLIGIFLWLSLFFTGIGLYFLMAFNKTELFPSNDRVSLINTLLFHSKRGKSLPFWNLESEFRTMVIEWAIKDSFYTYFFIIFSIIAFILTLIPKIHYKYKFVFLMLGFYNLFLIRGGIVFQFYIIPVFAFIALAFPIFIDLIQNYIKINKRILNSFLIILLIGISLTRIEMFQNPIVFTKNENVNILNALNWVRDNLSEDKRILIDNSNWMDYKKNDNFKKFENAHWFWKSELDSTIRKDYYNNNWKGVDYVVATLGYYEAVQAGIFSFNKEVTDNTFIVADFQDNPKYKVQHDIYRAVNGDWSTILKVDNDESKLNQILESFKENNMSKAGRVIENDTRYTKALDQSEFLNILVRKKDKNNFDLILNWAEANMILNKNEYIVSNKWGEYQSIQKILDPELTTQSNLNLLQALTSAYEVWKDESYLNKAKQLSTNLINKNFVSINAKLYPKDSNLDIFENNLYNFSPTSCNIFAMSKVAKYISVWSEIKENCYSLLKESLIQIGFISDKLQLNLNDGTWRKINNDKNANFNNNLHLIFNYISNDNLYFPSETSMSLAKQYEETINSRLTKYEYFNSYIEYDNKDIYPHTSTLSSIANLLYSTKSKNYTTFWKNNILKKLNYDDLDIVKTKSTTDSLNYLSVYMRYKGY